MSRASFTPTSRRDMHDIFAYIASDNPQAAVEVVQRIEAKCQQLAESPDMGFARDDLPPGLLAWPVGRYVILFRRLDGGTDVVRVVHGARDLGALFE